MLSSSEISWLECRKKYQNKGFFYCNWCKPCRLSGSKCCPVLHSDYKDAAEFEALVAAQGAAWTVLTHDVLNEIERDIRFKPMCLMVARLEVEELLDADPTRKKLAFGKEKRKIVNGYTISEHL